MVVEVSPRPEKKPKIAVFSGTKFSTSTLLCDRILRTLEEKRWDNLPEYLCRWLEHQASFSELPQSNSVLIETFQEINLTIPASTDLLVEMLAKPLACY